MSNRSEYLNSFPVPIVDPIFQKNYEWEKFDYPYWRKWMGSHWHWTVIISVVYVTLIHLGRRWMTNREPLKLRKPLIVWNTALAIFSLFGFYRIAPEMLNVLSQPNGFYHSVCTRWAQNTVLAFKSMNLMNANIFQNLWQGPYDALTCVLGMDLYSLKGVRAGRHRVYCTTEATTDFLALVSSVAVCCSLMAASLQIQPQCILAFLMYIYYTADEILNC